MKTKLEIEINWSKLLYYANILFVLLGQITIIALSIYGTVKLIIAGQELYALLASIPSCIVFCIGQYWKTVLNKMIADLIVCFLF